MIKRRLLKVGLIITVSLFSLNGCSDDENTKSQENTSVEMTTDEETQTETQEITTEEQKEGKFDPEDVCKNISINGELVEFPWTLNKLGDEYEFGNVTNSQEGDGVSAAYLLYKGEKIIMVSITGEQVDRDSTIHYITLWPNDEVKIYDFGCDTKVEDVVEKLGQPDQITEDELMLDYWYRYNDACLYMSFNSKSKVLEYVNFDLASNNK